MLTSCFSFQQAERFLLPPFGVHSDRGAPAAATEKLSDSGITAQGTRGVYVFIHLLLLQYSSDLEAGWRGPSARIA